VDFIKNNLTKFDEHLKKCFNIKIENFYTTFSDKFLEQKKKLEKEEKIYEVSCLEIINQKIKDLTKETFINDVFIFFFIYINKKYNKKYNKKLKGKIK
jgi:hypothetical protein